MSIWSHFDTHTVKATHNRRLHNNRLIHALGLLFFISLPFEATAQSVTPLRALLSPDNPSSFFEVSNPTDRLLAVRLDWLDMAAQADGSYLPAPENQRLTTSAAPHLVLEPASFQLSPGASRTIRVTARNGSLPASMAEKRSHLLIETQPVGSTLKTVSAKLPIDMTVGISVPVILRGGRPQSNALIEEVKLVRMADGGLALNVKIQRHGPHSLYGALKADIVGTTGQARRVSETVARRENIAIYPETASRTIVLELGRVSLPEGQMEILYEGRGAYAGDVLARRIFIVGPPSTAG